MARQYSEDVPSKAAIAGHPIHPMLIAFPIASFSLVLVCDIVYGITRRDFWAEASRWLLLAGLITGAAAAIFGLIDFLSMKRVRQLSIAWIHAGGNALAMVLGLINLLIRSDSPQDEVPTLGLVLSAVIGIILVVTGWLGGEMSYRHRIGVNSEGSEASVPERADVPMLGD
jgi:uncharacterized membrane protein